MKIVHLITGLEASGAEGMLARLVTAPGQDGIKHIVISMMDQGKLGPEIEAAGVPLHCLNMRRGLPSPLAFWRCKTLLEILNPDVLMTWLYHADLLGLYAGSMAGIKKIYWNLRCSNMEMRDYSLLSRMLVPWLANRAGEPTGVVVNSQAGRVVHETLGYRPKQWHLIPNGIDLDKFKPGADRKHAARQSLGLPSDAVIIGNVSRFDPMKDHRTLFDAWAQVVQKNKACHFLLVGRRLDRQNTALMQLVQEFGLDGKITLLGERSDIPDILPALDLMVLSSAFGEGFPNVLAEAMATAVPCVATDVGDASRLVGTMDQIVPPRHPDDLAKAIERFTKMDAEARQNAGLQARARAEKHFGMPAVVEQYGRLFRTGQMLEPE